MKSEKFSRKLAEIVVVDNITNIVATILVVNYVKVNNNIIISKVITHTNRELQGDPLSPLSI